MNKVNNVLVPVIFNWMFKRPSHKHTINFSQNNFSLKKILRTVWNTQFLSEDQNCGINFYILVKSRLFSTKSSQKKLHWCRELTNVYTVALHNSQYFNLGLNDKTFSLLQVPFSLNFSKQWKQ